MLAENLKGLASTWDEVEGEELSIKERKQAAGVIIRDITGEVGDALFEDNVEPRDWAEALYIHALNPAKSGQISKVKAIEALTRKENREDIRKKVSDLVEITRSIDRDTGVDEKSTEDCAERVLATLERTFIRMVVDDDLGAVVDGASLSTQATTEEITNRMDKLRDRIRKGTSWYTIRAKRSGTVRSLNGIPDSMRRAYEHMISRR